MRANRLIRLWPKLQPELTKVAFFLCKKYPFIDRRDLISEGILAIKTTRTTKKRPHRLTYLISRAKFKMIKYLRSELSPINRGFPLDDFIENL